MVMVATVGRTISDRQNYLGEGIKGKKFGKDKRHIII